VPGTRSGTGKTNPKPETRPRRSPGFFHACGSGSARGGRREGRHAPRLCCTGAVTRVATAARAEREKAAADILDCARCENGLRGKFPRAKARDVASTRFSRLFFASRKRADSLQNTRTFSRPVWHAVWKKAKSLQRRPSRNAQLESCVPARRLPSGRRFRVARWRCPSRERSRRDGDAREVSR
jgi:hypothetical protein